MENNIMATEAELRDVAGPSQQKEEQNSDSDSAASEGFDDYDIFETDAKKKALQSPKKRRGFAKLNPNLKGLMGEANVRYARGDIETAQKMCFEVMRQAPDAYEPYLTLAQIFENIDLTKYEGYLSIACCLCGEASVWCRLAELHLQNNKIKDAVSCYSRAIRDSPRNIDLHVRRLELVEALGDTHFALACKRNMANKLPRAQHQRIIEICKEVTKVYHEDKKYLKALETLEIPFKRIPKFVTPDLVNMKLELLLLTDQFTQCLDIFTQNCDFKFEITVYATNKLVINSYVMPPNIQIDLKAKFIIFLIKMKCFELLPELINAMISEENVEEIPDLYLDVAEELMTANLHEEALKLLVPLVKSSAYSLAALVWLKYADCLCNCNMLEQAVEAYFTVMTMAPQHVEVLYPLAMSLLKMNKKAEALEVLSQDLSSNRIDVAVLIERMKLLKQIGDLDEYWKCAELLFSRHCIILKYPEEIKMVLTYSTVNEKVKKLRKMRNFRGDSSPIETNYESIKEPTVEAEYELFWNILNFARDVGAYSQLQKLAFMGLTSRRFVSQFKDIMVAAFFACFYNNDQFHGYTLVRDLVFYNKFNNLAWSVFSLFLQNADDIRHNRFISRFQEHLPNFDCLQEIEANCSLSFGNLNAAMKFYMREFRRNRLPYFSFLLGVILLQKFSKRKKNLEDKRKLAEIVSCLFLYYANNRSQDAQHEAYYNFGRMYQELGVMYLAEHYYLKVLELPEADPEDILGLKHEAAYNLHLIYKSSGNMIAARNLLIKYVTV